MRLVSYQDEDGTAWGVQAGHGMVESARLGTDLPASLQAFIERCARTPGLVQQVAARAASLPCVRIRVPFSTLIRRDEL